MTTYTAKEYAEQLAGSLRTAEVEDVGDYLEDILDYKYTRNSRGDLVSVTLLVAHGGPNAWITFGYGGETYVECSWWSGIERVYVGETELAERVLDYFEESLLVS